MSPTHYTLSHFVTGGFNIDNASLIQVLKEDNDTPADARIRKAREHLKRARRAIAEVQNTLR